MLLVPIPAALADSGARLVFSPQRVVMEDGTRTARLSLRNGGNRPATFRVSLSDVLYQHDGSVTHTNTTPPGFPSAKPYVRFSPSQVRLNPGESQVVRVLLAGKPPGNNTEYRVHAVMQQLPESTTPNKSSNGVVTGGVSFRQASAIPVIIRIGKPTAQAGIASAQRSARGVDLVLTRSGSRSLYTQLEVYADRVAPANRIGLLKGFGTPVPNRQRAVSIPIKTPSNQPYIVVVKDQRSGEVLLQRNIN